MPLEWIVVDDASHHGGSQIMCTLPPTLGFGTRIWFRWDRSVGWSATTLESSAAPASASAFAPKDGYVPLGDM